MRDDGVFIPRSGGPSIRVATWWVGEEERIWTSRCGVSIISLEESYLECGVLSVGAHGMVLATVEIPMMMVFYIPKFVPFRFVHGRACLISVGECEVIEKVCESLDMESFGVLCNKDSNAQFELPDEAKYRISQCFDSGERSFLLVSSKEKGASRIEPMVAVF